MLVAGTTQAQSAELPKGPGSNALSQGQMAGFVWKKEPEALPDIAFVDGTGAQRTLADWKGRTVLLNLWATWCAPCRKEMPALDHLQAALGSDKFEVVALSVDRAGPEAAKRFLDQIAVQKLGLYVDKTARSSSALKVIGMPTTLLIDANGRELGRLVGPAEWDSDDAKRLIRAAMGTP
jgi:thiol-disulfide isomerase/thioredoxin